MSDPERTPGQENRYRCPLCKGFNDSDAAVFCSCVTAEPTLVCSRCGKCFCAAPAAWRAQFAASAASDAYYRRAHSDRRAAPRMVALPATRGKRVVLIVDDDKVVRLIATRALQGQDLTILHAADGPTGLRMAQELAPDLVITDALLPGLDGRELSRRIKTDAALCKTKVVVMTALYKGTRYKNEALKQFLVDDYMEKPVTSEKLLSVVARMLGSRMLVPMARAS
jgi:CheY-like chemotaxis protein